MSETTKVEYTPVCLVCVQNADAWAKAHGIKPIVRTVPKAGAKCLCGNWAITTANPAAVADWRKAERARVATMQERKKRDVRKINERFLGPKGARA